MTNSCNLLISLLDPIDWLASDHHPQMDDVDPGVRISISQPEFSGDLFDVSMRVTTLLPRAVAEGIDDLAKALVLAVDNSSAGQCGVQSLEDPFLWREPLQADNYIPPQRINPDSKITSWLSYRLTVEGLEVEQDAYFFTVFLLEWVSNTVMVNLSTLEIKDLGTP